MPADQSWDATDYDDRCSFVYEYGDDVVDLLDPDDGERVLDLGCGSGHLTDRIADRAGAVVGVDRSREMVAAARREYPRLPFCRADARALPVEHSFDAVFSNATLHWIPGPEQDAALSSIRDVLVPGGRLVAELGGTGNVDAIATAVAAELESRGHDATHPWYFPSVGEYASRLEANGFEVRLARLFDRPTDLDGGEDGLRAWLETFGDRWFDALSEADLSAVIAGVEDRLRPEYYRDGDWIADYRRLRVVAVRE